MYYDGLEFQFGCSIFCWIVIEISIDHMCNDVVLFDDYT